MSPEGMANANAAMTNALGSISEGVCFGLDALEAATTPQAPA
ncbi:hypothetical protein PTE31013_01198 [Pandoraea terrigena]|uniref:Uncharacterized protein n=1 Tax=Pandoraea terrigena TaxID=2508292 RepID=A0A5E4T4K3_9BURK|nr:hypothetical protein PTE31013_01198 [Pandoraea terrigena]